jgi:hypothetical protein
MAPSSTLGVPSTRSWTWAAIIVQGLGYLFDVLWHGVLSPGREPSTVAEMVRHLATVHLPLYVGALLVLATTAWAVARHVRTGMPGRAPYVALAGAAVSAGAEAWHATEHLQLDTHTAPIAGILSGVGYLVVVGAMLRSGRPGKRPAESPALRL